MVGKTLGRVRSIVIQSIRVLFFFLLPIQVKYERSTESSLLLLPIQVKREHGKPSSPPNRHHDFAPLVQFNGEQEGRRRGHQQGQDSTTMNELTALVSQALATVAMASKMLVAAGPLALDGQAQATDAIDVRTAYEAAAPQSPTTNTAPLPPQKQAESSNSAVREASAAYANLRTCSDDISGRFVASLENLRAASLAYTRPGEELHHSYEAYSRANRGLHAAENFVRDAEEQQAVTAGEFRRASEAAWAAERELDRAAMALRDFDVDSGDNNRSSSPKNGTTDEDNQRKEKKENGQDGPKDDQNNDADGTSVPPRTALEEEAHASQSRNTRSTHQRTGKTRASLAFALETARVRMEQAKAHKRRVLAEADAALTLVGARTAGEWSLASEAHDAAKRRFQRAGIEAVPKIKDLAEKAELFRNLNKLQENTRERLTAAAAAVAVARSMSAPVATAVAVKAAAEAAGRAAAESGRGAGEIAPLSAPATEARRRCQGGARGAGRGEMGAVDSAIRSRDIHRGSKRE